MNLVADQKEMLHHISADSANECEGTMLFEQCIFQLISEPLFSLWGLCDAKHQTNQRKSKQS